MLTYLSVSDFALINDLEVSFGGGLNVLTGETGAGKTVLIEAIGLLLGDRADLGQVRHGADEARMECAFDLGGHPELVSELEAEGYLETGETELYLGRTMRREGKSRCTVNGRLAPVSALARIGSFLVDIHGQNTHQALLGRETHVTYLDRFAGPEHLGRLQEYGSCYRRLSRLEKERLRLGAPDETNREAELLRHEIEQIDEVDPREEELEHLESEARRLRHSGELEELAARAEEGLSGSGGQGLSASSMLYDALDCLRKMREHDEGLEETTRRLESLCYESEDVSSELVRYRDALPTDPARLEELESRINSLRELARKFGGSIRSALEYLREAGDRLSDIERGRERAKEVEGEIEEEKERLLGLAEDLYLARRENAGELKSRVSTQMKQLQLEGASFDISVELSEVGGVEGCGSAGNSRVEFLFSPAPGEPLGPLGKIASGGEMSRVMLALKIVLAGADRVPVLIFDEVDSGIGGTTAGTIGRKLSELTGFHQVFCVTHLPQIAACADAQYRVFKDSSGAGTDTGVVLLSSDGRVEELCRMLGDTGGSATTREHAVELLEKARREAAG